MRGAVPGHDQPAGAGGQRAARDGAEVVRVGDLVEDDEHAGGQEPLRVGVGVSLDLQRHALVLVRAEELVELGAR